MIKIGELHKKLLKDGGYKFSRPYLSKLASQGKIPYVEEYGKKLFQYEDVVLALQTLQQKPKEGADNFDPKDEKGNLKTINSTKIMLQEYQGKIAQQKFDIEAGKLVYMEDVENKAFEVARVLRNQFLAIPERMAGVLASTTDPKEVKEILYTEMNEVLSLISNEKVLYE